MVCFALAMSLAELVTLASLVTLITTFWLDSWASPNTHTLSLRKTVRRINSIHNPARHCVRAYLLFVAVVLFGLVGPGAVRLKAQANDPLSDLGVPPFLTTVPVESGWIGMANGNLHLEIPLASFPQRGRPPITLALAYDSQIWLQYGCCVNGGTFG